MNLAISKVAYGANVNSKGPDLLAHLTRTVDWLQSLMNKVLMFIIFFDTDSEIKQSQ